MIKQNLIELVLHGSEERNLEYKTSISWHDNTTKEKVIKLAISMANIKDGGFLILGVDEIKNGVFEPNGMKKEHWDSFNQDNVMEYVNEYADPYIELKVDKFDYKSKLFIVIQIQEFEELPVVCKKNGLKLKRGEIYIRPRRKFESVLVPSQTEMREILEMAVDKKTRKYREKLFKLGLIHIPSVLHDDKEEFNEQLGEL